MKAEKIFVSQEILGSHPSKILEWVEANIHKESPTCKVYLDSINVLDPRLKAREVCSYYNLNCILTHKDEDYYNAIDNLKKGIQVAKANNLNELAAKMLINLSSSLGAVSKYESALTHLKEAESYEIEHFQDKLQFNFIKIYEGLHDEELHLQSIIKAKELALLADNKEGYAQALRAHSEYFIRMKSHESALKCCMEYEKFCTEENYERERLENIVNIASELIVCDRAEEALAYLAVGLPIAAESGDNIMALKLNTIGFDLAVRTDRMIIAEEYYKSIFQSEIIEGLEEAYLKAYMIDIERCKKLNDKSKLLKAYKAYKKYAKEVTIPNYDSSNTSIVDYNEKEIEEVRKENEKILRQNEELQSISYMLSKDLKLSIADIAESISYLEKKIEANDNSDASEYIDYLKRAEQDLIQKIGTAENFLNYNAEGEIITLDVKRSIEDVIDNLDIPDYTIIFSGESFQLRSIHSLLYDMFYNVLSHLVMLNASESKKIMISFSDGCDIEICDSAFVIYDLAEVSRNRNQNFTEKDRLAIYEAFMLKLTKMHNGTFRYKGMYRDDAALIINLSDIKENNNYQ